MVAVVLGGIGVYLAIARPKGRSATLVWDYDYSKDPPCGTFISGKSLQTKCVTGFSIFIRTVGARAGERFLPNRLKPDGTLASRAISAELPVHRYGYMEFCVTSVGKDENGRPVESYLVCKKRWVLPFLKDSR